MSTLVGLFMILVVKECVSSPEIRFAKGKKSSTQPKAAYSPSQLPPKIQPGVYCASSVIHYSWYAETTVAARYSPVYQFTDCLQLCAAAGCPAVNFYWNELKCEILKFPSDGSGVTLYSQGYSTFGWGISCYGLSTTKPTLRPPTTVTTTPTTTKASTGTGNTDSNICGKQAPGLSRSVFISRIVGGRETVPNTWPWQVSMIVTFLENGVSQTSLCGGTLIDVSYVLTAAHCLAGTVTNIRIVTGDHKLREPDSGEQIFNGKLKYKIHESYDSLRTVNDIALIKLSTPATLNKQTRKACLPTRGETVQAGTKCAISGWGTMRYDESDSNPISNVLNEAYVPIVDINVCNDARHYQGTLLPSVMLCAGYSTGGVDTCQGDSGGPLVCEKDGSWVLQGVVSFGRECANPLYPGVYTKVSSFIDWIETTKRLL